MYINKRTYYHLYTLLIILFSSILLLFSSCANPVAPTGGQKDKTAPGIDSTKSTPSPSTNFNSDRIQVSFDEWVKLDDVSAQLVISPPLEEIPEVKLKGKTVELIFKDSLRENTTYTVYFGNSIKDITEGNAAKNVNVTFSTGPYLDSLQSMGSVTDAFTGKKKQNVLVMLYDETASDSAVYKKKPLYLAKTESNGSFNIKHIKSGKYKVFALEDKNFNYLYDDTESIGFLKEPINITDSTTANIKLLVFTEEQPIALRGVSNKSYGKTRIAFNKTPEDIELNVLQNKEALNYYTEVIRDSIWFWYENIEEEFSLELREKNEILDTIEVKPTARNAFYENNKTSLDFDRTISRSPSRGPGKGKGTGKGSLPGSTTIPETALFEKARLRAFKKKLYANKKQYLVFNFPLKQIDASKVKVIEDSSEVAVPNIQLSDSLKRAIEIQYNWKPEANYSIFFEPGALIGFHDFTNDSLLLEVEGVSTEDFGSISLVIDSLNTENSYLLTLLNSAEQVIFEQKIEGVNSYEKVIEEIEPLGGYKVKLVEDVNNNGKWDPGSYSEKRAPERILIQPLQTVKPNWEVEGKIEFGKPKEAKKPGF